MKRLAVAITRVFAVLGLAATVATATLVAVGCGDNQAAPVVIDAAFDGTVDGMVDAMVDAALDASAPTTVASFCSQLSTTICAGLSACSCRFDQRAYAANECVAVRTTDCIAGFGGNVGPDLGSGRAVFDESSVQACLVTTTELAATCDLNPGIGAPLPFACSTVVRANVAVGGNCMLRAGGLALCGTSGEGVCLPDQSGPTMCVALPTAGTACFNNLCRPGLVCNSDTCQPVAALGAACRPSDSVNPCSAGLRCAPTGLCATPAQVDAACDSAAQCQTGLTCNNQRCAAETQLGDGCSGPGTCGQARGCGRAPENRTCANPDSPGDACMLDTCAIGLVCASNATCTPLPSAGSACLDGAYCAPGTTCLDGVSTCAPLPGLDQQCAAGARFCADGLGCRPSDNTCQLGPTAGQACLLNPPAQYVCGSGLGCDFTASGSLCAPLTDAGAACNTDRTCTAATFCDGATQLCTARHAAGDRCSQPNECVPGLECAFAPGGPRCRPIPTTAQPCDTACVTGWACKGPGGECVPAFCTMP